MNFTHTHTHNIHTHTHAALTCQCTQQLVPCYSNNTCQAGDGPWAGCETIREYEHGIEQITIQKCISGNPIEFVGDCINVENGLQHRVSWTSRAHTMTVFMKKNMIT